MKPARTPHGGRLDELLADGNWHPLTEVIDVVARAVPPGQAHRRTEADHAYRARERRAAGAPAVPSNSRPGDPETVGARAIARRTIDGRVRKGTVERDGDMIRKAW